MSKNGTQRKTKLEVLQPSLVSDLPNLAEEIKEGTLLLRADTFARSCFSFSVADYTIGIYGARSVGLGSLALIRRWDQVKEVKDPISGLLVVNRGRQFDRVRAQEALFLFEYTSDFLAVVSRVAFKARKVRVRDADLPGASAEMRFEVVELLDVEMVS